MPRVSVLVPFHNAAEFLPTALASILAQSYSDFELILIDDGSTDASRTIAAGFAADRRVRVIDQPRRAGVAAALAAGLQAAEGEYVARHDADDWSAPERFAKQVRLLDERRDVALCGTFAWDVLPGGLMREERRKTGNPHIRVDALFRMPLLTTTAMGRRAYFMTYGCEEAGWAFCGDYASFAASLRSCVFENIPELLMHKRVHASSLTGSTPHPEIAAADRTVKRRVIEALGIVPTGEDMRCHDLLASLSDAERRRQQETGESARSHTGLPDWCARMLEGNARHRIFDQTALATVLEEKQAALSRAMSVTAQSNMDHRAAADALLVNTGRAAM